MLLAGGRSVVLGISGVWWGMAGWSSIDGISRLCTVFRRISCNTMSAIVTVVFINHQFAGNVFSTLHVRSILKN